jgi:thioester reductase-like protein/amino acid adenylation domain-containing protein
MLEDADARVIVTSLVLANTLPNNRATVLCIDAPMADIPPSENSAVACTPQNLAYVLFTSGSTGRPKGVQIEHHSAVAMLCWARDVFSARERAYVLASTSICFDLSVFEIFAPLSWGGAVVLAENALELPSLPWAERITLINTVPSAIAELVRINGIPQSVITINLAGEPLKGQLVQDIYRNTQAERVLNLYGPSEDTTYSTWACIPRGSEAAPTIGRPISNTKVFVLSPYMQPVPIGAIGELYIGGEGLSRGYLKRPELTVERFVRNPFSDNPDARMYKTGDFVRYLPNGELQYLGRIDNQVKLRGFRIELGEVEEILSRFPGVQEVAALIKHDRHQTAKLVAYLAPKLGVTELLSADLREYARTQLPYFMVPTEFFVLDHMPHSPNGKIDRAALPEPICDHVVTEETRSASALEQLVRSVWSEILGRSSIGSDEHFFETGGHSLLAAKVIYRLNEILDIELNVGAMFEFPTIAALAGAIQAAKSDASHFPESGESRVDLVAEAVLSPEIFPSDAASATTTLVNAKAVLLSGATGFVGSYLLMELLNNTNAVIHCLVRGDDTNTAMQRIDAAVGRHGFRSIANFRSRIKPVLGDLDAPRFGLSEEEFENLAIDVDILFHSAATINLTYPYRLLKPTNVDGTSEFIRLACTGTVKPLHYVSTISVFDADNYFDGRVIREDDEPDDIQGLDHGYAQSKWVAERRVKAAAQRGLPVTIYRLGSVIGASDTGIWQADDIMHRMLSAAMELGQWLNVDLATYLTPVDYVARSIVELSRHESSQGQTFHLVASNTVRSEDIREWLCGSGVKLTPVSAPEWKANFVKQLTNAGHAHWASLLLLIETAFSNEQLAKLAQRHARSPRFDCTATERALNEAAIAIPMIDERMMQRFLGVNDNFGLSSVV